MFKSLAWTALASLVFGVALATLTTRSGERGWDVAVHWDGAVTGRLLGHEVTLAATAHPPGERRQQACDVLVLYTTPAASPAEPAPGRAGPVHVRRPNHVSRREAR